MQTTKELTELTQTQMLQPQLGEIRRGREIGKPNQRKSYIGHACLDCGKERWVQLHKGKPLRVKCLRCGIAKSRCEHRGANSHLWKGGRIRDKDGYIYIRLQPDDFFYPMITATGYVCEHRLVIAKALGRCLLPWEVVHHKGAKYPIGSKENKGDNRYPENLELLPQNKQHLSSMKIAQLLRERDKRIEQLEKRVILLEAENILLRREERINESETYSPHAKGNH